MGRSLEVKLLGHKQGVRGGEVEVWVPVAVSKCQGQAVVRQLWPLHRAGSAAKPSTRILTWTSDPLLEESSVPGCSLGEWRLGPCTPGGLLKRLCGSLVRQERCTRDSELFPGNLSLGL